MAAEQPTKSPILEAAAAFARDFEFYPLFQNDKLFQAENSNGNFTVTLLENGDYAVKASSDKIRDAVVKAITEAIVAPADQPPIKEEKNKDQASPELSPSVPTSHSIFDQITDRFGFDLLEVFGETGTLKSKGMVALALETAQSGKKVYYLDTENNLTPAEVKILKVAGVQYTYTPVLKQIAEIIEKRIPNCKADLLIIDSVGMPILRKYASMGVKDRGDALLDLIAWLGILKEWSFNNHALSFITNQPVSEFGKSDPKEKGDYRNPFGDKGNFVPGHILLSKKDADTKGQAKGRFVAFRSRALARGETVFNINVTNGEAKITIGFAND